MIRENHSHGEKYSKYVLVLFTLAVILYASFLLLLFSTPIVAYAEEYDEVYVIESEETNEDSTGDYISDNDDTYSDSEQISEENDSEDVSINVITDGENEEDSEEAKKGVNINLVTEEGTEVVEVLDEEGNVIGYRVQKTSTEDEELAEEATDEASLEASVDFEKYLKTIDKDLVTLDEKADSLYTIVCVMVVILGGMLIYLFIHWSMKRKGVME